MLEGLLDGSGTRQNNTQTLATVETSAQAAKHTSGPTPSNLPETERIQRAIIDYFYPRLNANIPTSSQPKDNTARRSQFLQALREGQISSTDERTFLETLPAPVDTVGARQLFGEIVTSARQKQILAVITGYNPTNWEDVLAKDLETFLSLPRRGQSDYRTPMGFADLRRRFLLEIRDEATPEQFDDYIKSMDGLENIIYGERYAYYHEFEDLRKEARAMGQSIDTVATAEPEIDPADPASIQADNNTAVTGIELATISEERRDQLLGHAIIEGDAWRQGNQEYQLTTSSLISAGLVPYFAITVENQNFYFSNLFKLTSDQMAAIAYVPTPSGVKVRSFYRERNSALWHYLPDYVRDINGEGIGLYGDGFNEHSTILPIALQASLNQIERNRNILDLTSTNPDFLFAGTAYAYNTRQEYHDAFSRGLLRGDFYQEVSSTAYNADSGAIISPNHRKQPPQLLSVNSAVAPNFHEPAVKYSVYSTFAGQVNATSFPANDEQTTWLFYNDYRGRCWVANIETNSYITTTGCRREWLLPTDICTPLYELSRLAGGYGDPSDTRSGSYTSMWNNYLSKVPLIEQYSKILAAENPIQSDGQPNQPAQPELPHLPQFFPNTQSNPQLSPATVSPTAQVSPTTATPSIVPASQPSAAPSPQSSQPIQPQSPANTSPEPYRPNFNL